MAPPAVVTRPHLPAQSAALGTQGGAPASAEASAAEREASAASPSVLPESTAGDWEPAPDASWGGPRPASRLDTGPVRLGFAAVLERPQPGKLANANQEIVPMRNATL